MDRKIIAIMVTLVVVAALVVAFVMVAAGGFRQAGGFTELFDKLEYTGNGTHNQDLALPTSWHVGDKKEVSDTIVDMEYSRQTVGSTSVYITTLWFVYEGNKWNNPLQGTSFHVPVEDGLMHVDHGLFHITVSSATNLSAVYDVGEVITMDTMLKTSSSGALVFSEWAIADTL